MSQPAPRARRWPDLLIGLLVALLLVGFGLLLFRPDTRTAATPPSEPATATTPSIPSAPAGADPAPVPATTGTATTTEPPTIAAAPVEATQPITTTPAPATTPTTGTSDATGVTTPSTTSGTATTPRTGGAVTTSEQRVPLRSDYRITLGTFSNAQGATTAAAPVSALGYTVYPIDLGSQVVAQVGPFADEATARQALADIQRAYPSAVLYPPRNRSLTQTTSATGTTTTAAPSATPATTAPAAPNGPTYLQVGAFDRVDSAQKLVQQLRDLGYAPTVNAPEGKKVTVLVGPYTGDAVTRTETRLNANGLDHFRVR